MEKEFYKSIINEYTDLLIEDFLSFLDLPLFEGKTFIERFSGPEDRRNTIFNTDALERMIQALQSLNVIANADGYLKFLGGPTLDTSGIRAALDLLPKANSLEDELKNLESFFSYPYIKHQLEKVPCYQEYLKNSITYDLLVVRKFLSPHATYLGLLYGKSIVSEVFGLTSRQIFDHYQDCPLLLRVYGLGFASSHFLSDIDFISKINFSNGEEIADIGAGYGHLGNLILKANSDQIYYLAVDLPGVRDAFKDELYEFKQLYRQKFDFVEGNFFGPHSYIQGIEGRKFQKIFLGWILHDWSDSQCIEILRKCRSHMDSKSELYIFELLPNSRKLTFTFTDWLMLVMADGYERSLEQYEKIFNDAGFKLDKVFQSESARSMLRIVQND
ncbi:MAG: methyltransferase [Bacteriovoracaceae bacterium]